MIPHVCRLVALRLWNEDDVGILSSTMLQCRYGLEAFGLLLLAEDDCCRHMLQVLVLEDTEEAHDGFELVWDG